MISPYPQLFCQKLGLLSVSYAYIETQVTHLLVYLKSKTVSGTPSKCFTDFSSDLDESQCCSLGKLGDAFPIPRGYATEVIFCKLNCFGEPMTLEHACNSSDCKKVRVSEYKRHSVAQLLVSLQGNSQYQQMVCVLL